MRASAISWEMGGLFENGNNSFKSLVLIKYSGYVFNIRSVLCLCDTFQLGHKCWYDHSGPFVLLVWFLTHVIKTRLKRTSDNNKLIDSFSNMNCMWNDTVWCFVRIFKTQTFYIYTLETEEGTRRKTTVEMTDLKKRKEKLQELQFTFRWSGSKLQPNQYWISLVIPILRVRKSYNNTQYPILSQGYWRHFKVNVWRETSAASLKGLICLKLVFLPFFLPFSPHVLSMCRTSASVGGMYWPGRILN